VALMMCTIKGIMLFELIIVYLLLAEKYKQLRYCRQTALQGGSVLAKCNWETIFCGHYMSNFNNCEVIGLQSYRIRRNNA